MALRRALTMLPLLCSLALAPACAKHETSKAAPQSSAPEPGATPSKAESKDPAVGHQTATKRPPAPRPKGRRPASDRSRIRDEAAGSGQPADDDEAPKTASEDRRGSTLRAGARRLETFHAEDYYVTYRPDRSIRLRRLDRTLGERRLAARVTPLEQIPASRGWTAVERGGEIVALSLAAQLHAMGWIVGLEQAPGMLKPAKRYAAYRVDLSAAVRVVQIGGTVSFALRHHRAARGHACAANVSGTVTLRRGGRVLHSRRIDVTERATSARKAGRSARAKRAARDALARFVRTWVDDTKLESALVELVKRP